MDINDELNAFQRECLLLSDFTTALAKIESADITASDHFLAEAILFRLYRSYERLMRAVFLHFCVSQETDGGREVKSKLICDDWITAERILNSGKKSIDWGSAQAVRELANLVFENGFPVVELIVPLHSTLIDLQRFRNFVAHSSQESENGFKKSLDQYIKKGHDKPKSVGELAVYRRSLRGDITLRIIFDKVSKLPEIYRSV